MTDQAIVVQPAGFLAPVINVENALAAFQAKKDLIDKIMKNKTDYGVIPGTTKPTLLKAGAEKATSFFGLHPVFKDACIVEDWTGENHGGEPFFYYRRTCELYRNGELMTSVDGSCNSWEKKYRYRTANRKCPVCKQETIIKGKEEYGGGWICFKSKGGCGAKFKAGDQAIEGQETGQIKNPDVAETVNTILKMADKRALIAATLIATGMSEYFTQDVEDYVDGEYDFEPDPVNTTRPTTPAPQKPAPAPQNNGHKDDETPVRPYAPEILKSGIASRIQKKGIVTASEKQSKLLLISLNKCFEGDTSQDPDKARHAVTKYLTGKDSTKDMTGAEITALLDWLKPEKDSTGDYVNNADSVKEAYAIVRQSLLDAGQMELLSTAEQLGGKVN